ncbi:hypothetical protein [Streptomyces sp. P9-A2]|uniref:hypothetical protein n=1 Tax=Streptomyces sp. P9-A2 TaxID=3072284 RepID=UPI002FC7BAC8
MRTDLPRCRRRTADRAGRAGRGGPGGAAALDWQPCEDPAQQGFDCATLEVPLDHDRPAGETIDLALIRHKATGPSERIGSTIIG